MIRPAVLFPNRRSVGAGSEPAPTGGTWAVHIAYEGHGEQGGAEGCVLSGRQSTRFDITSQPFANEEYPDSRYR
ncbi:MAG: hypothetical protein KatS3mg056_3141 [Chloroflexus sp.]|jgi:hypothetical protein|nr:MAG: hypothetical protein KatS3mg056_3141 [Chloroflexus sp.]